MKDELPANDETLRAQATVLRRKIIELRDWNGSLQNEIGRLSAALALAEAMKLQIGRFLQ